MSSPDTVIVTPGLGDNSLGRTWCLWQLCRAAGWDATVVSVAPAEPVWEPLRGTTFAAACRSLPLDGPGNTERVRELLAGAALVLVVKALPASLGRVHPLLAGLQHVVVDVDDPDIEATTLWLPPRALAGGLVRRGFWDVLRCRVLVRRHPVIVSNPVLARMYGGSVVPHVREDTGPGAAAVAGEPLRVAFVGTAKTHKGIDVLREAVAGLAADGVRLDVTAPAPPDAMPHETWHGATSIAAGTAITRAAGVVAVPSLATGYARAQFPAKIVDAQIAARAIVASDVGPIGWALGDGGRTVPPGDVAALREVIAGWQDAAERTAVGARARERALEAFTIPAALPAFTAAVGPHRRVRTATPT